ncbi:MAG: hypothetical protein PVH48_05340 [Cyclobacteriaceae bacterium]|jgi:hypothetical protein
MKILQLVLVSILFLSTSIVANAQEVTEHIKKEKHINCKRHNIFLLWGNTLVPAAKTAEGENSVMLFPSWGINYEYKIKHNYGLALMNEFEMQSYAVEHDAHADIEREYPIITSIVFVYEPVKHLSLFAGPGIEFERSHNFSIIKAGAAVTFALPKYYGIALEFSYERKNKTYDAWTFGLLIGKGFGKTLSH